MTPPFLKFMDERYPDGILPYAASREEAMSFIALGKTGLIKRIAAFKNSKQCALDFENHLLAKFNVKKVKDLPSPEEWQKCSANTFSQWVAEQGDDLSLMSAEEVEKAKQSYLPIDNLTGDADQIKKDTKRIKQARRKLIPFQEFLKEKYAARQSSSSEPAA